MYKLYVHVDKLVVTDKQCYSGHQQNVCIDGCHILNVLRLRDDVYPMAENFPCRRLHKLYTVKLPTLDLLETVNCAKI